MNSKDKGKRGERAWTKILKANGWDAKRTGFHQSQQGHDSPDVTCKDLPIHWEVKNAEKCLIRDWIAQAVGDAKDYEIPCVTWKSNNRPWIAILPAEDLLTILRHADVAAIEEEKQIEQQTKKGLKCH